MRKNSTFLSFLFLLAAFANQSTAQNAPCGMKYEDLKEVKRQMMENRMEMRDFVRTRDAVTYVPVRFYLVAKTDGTGRTSERKALRALCNLNEAYADQNIQFFLKEFKYLNNTTVYSNPISNSGANQIKNQMIYNAMNIFIVDYAGEEGVLAYYQPPATGPNKADWIVAIESDVDDNHTLAHEVGHYFTIPHPFYGWESSNGWDPDIHGNPVGFWSPDGEKNEFVNGSNCDDAGDGICDTPADYMFPYPGQDNCTYDLDAKDPSGAPLQPVMNNFMNYAICSDYFFTDDQKDNISNSLFSSSRNYINTGVTPNTTPIGGSPTLIAPAYNQVVETYNSVHFEWTPVAGADRYLLELEQVGSSGSVQTLVVNSNTYFATNLQPSKNYFWRVLGFNEYATCSGFSAKNILKTGGTFTDTSEIPSIEDWSVDPNPVHNNQSFFVNVNSLKTTEAKVGLYSFTGQIIREVEYVFRPGSSSLEIAVEGLSSGLYFVALKSTDGVETKRISIVE